MKFDQIMKIIYGVLCFLCCMYCQNSFGTIANIYSREELQEVGISVEHLDDKEMLKLLQMLYTDPTVSKNEIEETMFISDLKQLDMNHDGKKDSVAFINHRGTIANPIGVILLYSIGENWTGQIFNTERARMETSIVDLNQDGIYEIAVNETIIGDTPHALVEYWINIYSWDGQSYVENNAQFVESFYRQRYLPSLAKQLEGASEMLRNGERRATISAMLQDCRTALERVVALSTIVADASNRSRGFARELESVSTQIGAIQIELRQEGHQDDIHAALEQTRQALQQLSAVP